MDAKRSQVYTGLYHTRDGLEVVLEQPMDMRSWRDFSMKKGERVIFLGDGVPVYEDIIREMLTVPPCLCTGPDEPAEGCLRGCPGDERDFLDAEGCHGVQVVTAAEFTPDYLRKPQAERQRGRAVCPAELPKLPGDYWRGAAAARFQTMYLPLIISRELRRSFREQSLPLLWRSAGVSGVAQRYLCTSIQI